MSKGLDKYLQDAEQCHALDLNYFDDTTRPTSVEPVLEAAGQTNESSEYARFSLLNQSMQAPWFVVVSFCCCIVYMIHDCFWENYCESVPLDHTGSYISISMENTMYK